MSKSITIRDVPDGTHERLSARAALMGRSLQEYLRIQLIEIAAKPDPEELMTEIRKRKNRTGQSLTRDSIVAHRDADRA